MEIEEKKLCTQGVVRICICTHFRDIHFLLNDHLISRETQMDREIKLI